MSLPESSASHRPKFWFGLLISAVFLYFALRDVQWAGVLSSWRSASVFRLVAGTALLIAAWWISAVRWRVLLAPAPELRVRDTFAYITIGYLANTVLPLRLGDLARASLIGRNKQLGISRSLGSMAFERVLDLLTLLTVTLLLTLVMEIPPMIQAGLFSMTVLAIGALVFLLVMSVNRNRLHHATRWLGLIVPMRWAERVVTLASNFTSGVDVFRRPLRLLAVFALSIFMWCTVGFGTWIWIDAFGIQAPWFAGLFVLVMVNLGSAIPSSPGYVGVYHYLAVLALSVWVPDRSPALAYALGTHAINMLANVLLGSYFLVREGVSLREIGRSV